ncbi:MAG: hypothetical protein AB2L26_13045 [Ignavibacteria bacterium]
MLSFLGRNFVFGRYVKKMSAMHINGCNTSPEETISRTYRIKRYAGNNIYIKRIFKILKSRLNESLKHFIINGSSANSEEVPYSDLDLIVILSDSVIKDARQLRNTLLCLNDCIRIIHEFDPLQHHGFFVLFEYELSNYPVQYFPDVIFNYCGSLEDEIELTIRKSLKQDFAKSFSDYRNSFLKSIYIFEAKKYNSYFLKDFISRFLLLPSVYLSSVLNDAVYKKDSFKLIREYKEKEFLATLDLFSEFRLEWKAKFRKGHAFFSSSSNPFLRFIFIRANPLFASNNITEKMDKDVFNRVKSFIENI